MKLFTIVISEGQSEAPPFEPLVFKAHIVNEQTKKHRMLESLTKTGLLYHVSQAILSGDLT